METMIETTANTVLHKSKWLIKGGIIGFIALVMLIPMLYVKNLVLEREDRQKEAAREISSKWAGPQNIIGPVIGIPYWEPIGTDTTGKVMEQKQTAWFLPDSLLISATVTPKEKHRGIFKVMLFESNAKINGLFKNPGFDKLDIPLSKYIWNEAFVMMSIADTKGLNDQLTLQWNDDLLEFSTQTGGNADGMKAMLKINSAEELNNISFSTIVNLNGSEQLRFTPVGKSTSVNMKSSWKDPSFSGNILPQNSDVNDTGFIANWKSMAHKRNYPQQWKNNDYNFSHFFINPSTYEAVRFDGSGGGISTQNTISGKSISNASFGVDLFIPINGYQKTLRTIKYALLCILLTFAAFFLIETSNKKSAHPFQYGLIGLALILFYTLLLSISEYTGFNAAYFVASVATIGLISWFVMNILKSARITTILSVVLVLIYSYIFSIMQLQDYSLLLGSIGLFLTLAVIMNYSKKLNW